MNQNPIIYSDFPDIDIIRVGDTYYMASTTMHFMPGGAVLRSYDLMNWELIAYVYDELDGTPAQRLEGEENIYGQGMWAPSFRYHDETFYFVFSANDTQKTYLFTATDPKGPWKKNLISGFYHDSSLFFDDQRVFIIYGNKTIYLTELDRKLTGPKVGGLHRVISVDEGDVRLGYEGAKIYKKDGMYYLFMIHWPNTGYARRMEVCLMADSLEGQFKGGTIIDDDLDFYNQGVAQGGIVDTPDGDWYMFMFQDRGAVGRVPVMIAMEFVHHVPTVKNGKISKELSIPSTRENYNYLALNIDDDFKYRQEQQLNISWQFNHQPLNDYWSVSERVGAFRIKSEKICKNLSQARNTLTQRTMGPKSSASVTVDGSNLLAGDYAGICALQGNYSAIALTKEGDQYYLSMLGRGTDYEAVIGNVNDQKHPIQYARIPVDAPTVTLKISVDFENLNDTATFFYEKDGVWQPLGIAYKLHFKLDHFVGCRFGLFLYSTVSVGGSVDFMKFRYESR